MFEKYNIDDLFLAYINIFYKKSNGELEYITSSTTILKKVKENKYINLKNSEIIPSSIHPNIKRIGYIEPLSYYYHQNGKKKAKVSKDSALEQLKINYKKFYQKCEDQGKTYVFTKKISKENFYVCR